MVLDAPTVELLGQRLYVPKEYSGYSIEVYDIDAGDTVPDAVNELIFDTYFKRLGIDLNTGRFFNPTGHVFALYYEGQLVTTAQAADPNSPHSDFSATMGRPFPVKPNTIEITRVASRKTPVGHATGFELLVITAGNYLKELGIKTAIGYSKPHMVDVAKKFFQSPVAGPIDANDGGSYYVYEIQFAGNLALANLLIPSLSIFRAAKSALPTA